MPAPVAATKEFFISLMDGKERRKLALMMIAWVAACVVQGIWMYYYLHDVLYPVPRDAVDRTDSGFAAFEGFMFIFGFGVGVFSLVFSLIFLLLVWPRRKLDLSPGVRQLRRGVMYLSIPILLFLIIMPFFGPWILGPFVSKSIWVHGCDSYPVFVILDAKKATDPSSVPNLAHFFMNRPSAHSPTRLFTFELTYTPDGYNYIFNLSSWDSPQASIPLEFYPTLQAVHYNLTASTLNGNCTLPTTPGGSTEVVPCASGTFNLGEHLSFNITSSVPLNATSASAHRGTPNSTVALAIPDKGWAFQQYPPAVRLAEVESGGALGSYVLKTTIFEPHDVTQLKVCVAGPEDRPNPAVQPEVLAPMGLILMKQVDYAEYATEPSTNS